LTAAKELYDLGLIDEAEFKAAKAEILSQTLAPVAPALSPSPTEVGDGRRAAPRFYSAQQEIPLHQDSASKKERQVDALCNLEILAVRESGGLRHSREGGAISTSSMLDHAYSPNPQLLLGDASGGGSGGGRGAGGNLSPVHARKELVSLAQARSLTFSWFFGVNVLGSCLRTWCAHMNTDMHTHT